MLRPEKLATPLEAATVVVPERVPPAGLVPMAIVILPEKVVTRFPPASSTEICTAGLIELAAVVSLGCAEKTS